VSPGSSLTAIPALERPDGVLSPEQALDALPDTALLEVTPAMRAFVLKHTAGLPTQRQRLTALHGAIRGAGVLDLDYDVNFTGSAIETFEARRANCLSYAHLLVALAREAGLHARYQEVMLRPNWSRQGDTAIVGLHVNVVLGLRNGEQLVADIDPLVPGEATGTRRVSDREAAAMHFSNMAVEALTHEQLVLAYQRLVKALTLAPDVAHLWLNLGSVLRRNGQIDAAEQAYFKALDLDPEQSSAMNNLALLYDLRGDTALADQWRQRVNRQRQRNPHYHAWLGTQAQQEGDLAEALTHYQRALRLRSDIASIHFDIANIYLALGDQEQGRVHRRRAVQLAPSRYERNLYELRNGELAQGVEAER